MGFCSCVNKLFLVVLNFIIFAVGVGVIALASVVIHRSSEYGQLLFDGVLTLPIWTLIVGIIITMLGFFGCCGAMKENRCMLITYASVVTVLFIAELTLGILVAIYPDEAKGHIKSALDETFNKYGGDDESLNKAIDSVQHDMKCCGVEGPDDWEKYDAGKAPQSCCIEPQCDTSVTSSLYKTGCFYAIIDDLEGVTIALGVTALILCLIQVMCICIACGLAQRRHEYV